MRSCHQIVASLSFFLFISNQEQSGSRIPDAQSVKPTFSLKVFFYLTNTANRTNNLQHSSYTIALNKATIIAKKIIIFCKKNADICKIKRILVLKGIFSEIMYVCVYLRIKFQVSGIILTSFRQKYPPPPP